MTKLTDQQLKNISEMLGVTEEQFLNMTEEEQIKEMERIEEQIRQLEQVSEKKSREIAILRSENRRLRFDNIGLNLVCTVRQIQIGLLQTIRDIKSWFNNV